MKIRSGSYANVASTLALVVALGGTSYAAVAITGKDIKNGTVTSADVKNKTLKLKDFSSKAKTGLTGATGPAGPKGDTGAAGTAVAYAVINADGSLNVAKSSANLTAAMVANDSSSASCWRNLPFTVKSAIAVATYDGGVGTSDEMVQVAQAGAGFTSDCPAGTVVEVAGYSGGNYARVPYVIWFQ
jgi:hypothetical protein